MTGVPSALLQGHRIRDLWPGSVIDADVHANPPSLGVLGSYLDEVWRQHIAERQWRGPKVDATYPPGLLASARQEWRPDDGAPASSAELLVEHILDPVDADYAIVNCVYPIDGGGPPDLSVALARAVNDWLIAEWLDSDGRIRASIVLPDRDPAAMAAEVDRVGSHPGFVQALLPVRSGRLYGKRLYYPLFDAIVRNDLVAGIHWGGSNDLAVPTPSGWPSWYVEEYCGEVQVFEAQLLSLISEGVFQAFPDLRVALLEIGFTWLPTFLWRMDKEWKGMRREIPWVSRSPIEIVRDHVRLSVAPLDADSAEELVPVIKWLGSEDLLMFATDYPHMHDDDLRVLLAASPDTMREKLMSETARSWYRLGEPPSR